VVDDLPQELDGGLGAVGLQHGHVDIVDEHDHLAACRGSEVKFKALRYPMRSFFFFTNLSLSMKRSCTFCELVCALKFRLL